MRTFIALVVTAALCCLLNSCGSRHNTNLVPCPWQEKNAPQDLLIAADDLLAFQSVIGRVPITLAEIDESNVTSRGAYARRAYAYHPTGIGVLSEGWRILIADDQVRQRNYLWCVLRPPSRSARLSGLRVALVPLREVHEAARMAGRGADSESINLLE